MKREKLGHFRYSPLWHTEGIQLMFLCNSIFCCCNKILKYDNAIKKKNLFSSQFGG